MALSLHNSHISPSVRPVKFSKYTPSIVDARLHIHRARDLVTHSVSLTKNIEQVNCLTNTIADYKFKHSTLNTSTKRSLSQVGDYEIKAESAIQNSAPVTVITLYLSTRQKK